MSSVLWSFMNCLAVVFVKEDFLSTFLKRKKNRRIFICIWMFYFLFHFMTKVENCVCLYDRGSSVQKDRYGKQ